MAKQAITAPAPRPGMFGIVSAAPILDDNQEWHQGFKFNPEGCGASGVVSVECEGNTAQMDAPDNPTFVEGDPFAVYASDKCSTIGYLARDYEGRARRQLETTRSYQIAREMWRGDLATADGLDNLMFTDPSGDVITTTADDPLDAFAALDGGLSTVLKGRQGMIHVTPQLLAVLKPAFAVELRGTTYISPNGHIVVNDAGYDGSGPQVAGVPTPAGATQWAYATSLISLRMADVMIVPGSLADAKNMAAALDREVNTVIVYASQLVAYEWDECALLQAEIDLPIPVFGGVS